MASLRPPIKKIQNSKFKIQESGKKIHKKNYLKKTWVFYPVFLIPTSEFLPTRCNGNWFALL